MNKKKDVSKTDREKPNRDLEPAKDAKGGGGFKPVSGGGGNQVPAPPPPAGG
jgi:hypothetical protein